MILLILLLFFPIQHEGRIRPSNDLEKIYEQATLPLKLNPTSWVALEEIEKRDHNFTLFSDEDFAEIKQAYLLKNSKKLQEHLQKAYRFVERRNHFPSLFRLKVENFYLNFPWIPVVLVLSIASLLFPRGLFASYLILTALLLLRVIILERPMVSSMYETMLFVPWVATSLSLILFYIYRHPLLLLISNLILLAFFSILFFTDTAAHLETIQPVLNSQFWLSIHVLMVVGSYGIFALASLLGHAFIFKPSKLLEKILLNVLYLGVISLTAGTLLGGVWAAQSWGRFWDWDPKESWAFISISLYLVAIHLYRFGKIGSFGLSMGAVIGFLAISFCWYGVNYIIGTGLHSYGFGSGGLIYYLIFIALESLFLLFALTTKKKTKIVRRKLIKGS